MADQTGSRLPDDPTTAWYAQNWDTIARPGTEVEPVAGYRITAERWYADGGYISPSQRYPLPSEADDIMGYARSSRWYHDPQAAALAVLLGFSALWALVSLIL